MKPLLVAQCAFVALTSAPACEPKRSHATDSATTRQPAAPGVVPAVADVAGNGGGSSNPGSGAGAAARASGGSTVADSGATSAPAPGTDESGCESTPVKPAATPTRFAVMGDYGAAGPAEERVAKLVKSWHPEFIVTTGDNNYPSGGADTIDANIGQFFHDFICPYRGGYGPGSKRNRFFPALGNHDWYTLGAKPYLDYFTLPGKERYYDLVWGDVHVFALDSDPNEPDGVSETSVQAAWLKAGLATSTARWQLVTMHHPPYSSGPHANTVYMQWPYKQWGVDLVLAGHDHTYERVTIDGLPYIVSGLGGASIYPFSTPIDGSQVRYNTDFSAGLIEADSKRLVARFFDANGERIDELVLDAP